MADSPFGRVITAMVTPMHDDGSIDYDGLQRLAVHLADHGHDGLLVNGTTGESATTTDEEDYASVQAVVEAVGDRAQVMAGCGTNDTEHSTRAGREMLDRGADALLVVTPYYIKPPQDCILEHFREVAAAAEGAPVMLYDIPGRTGTALATDTIRRAAEIDNILAVKDAKGDFFEASRLMAQTDLLWFSGDDIVNLPHLAQGATGVVSVVGHVAGDLYAEMIAAIDRGDLPRGRQIHRRLIPAVDAVMHVSQGAVQAKAAMKLLGIIDSDALRMPLRQGPADHYESLRVGLTAAGLL